jgi:hypothetical protein
MPMSGRLMITSIRLPIHMLAIMPQNMLGRSLMICGPGWMPWMVSARGDVNPVGQFRNAESEARSAGVAVGADETDQETEHDHGDRLDQRAMSQHHRGDEAEHHQREIFRRSERSAHFGERRRKRGDQRGRDAAREKRAECRHRQRSAGAALSRHLVAVDAGHYRGRLARQIHQNGRGRAAILGAVEDAREHDQARCRFEMEGERQQHRDSRDRADAGENADQCPNQRAGEREEKVGGRQRHAESDREIVQKLHLPLRPDRDGQSQSEDEDAPGENDQH